MLDTLVESWSDKQAAKKFFRKPLKRLRYVPRVIITGKPFHPRSRQRVLLLTMKSAEARENRLARFQFLERKRTRPSSKDLNIQTAAPVSDVS